MRKITCIMVSRSHPSLVEKAMICYRKQEYCSRELIVVTDSGNANLGSIQNLTRTYSRGDMKHINFPAGTPLGVLRNKAVGVAEGDIICQWDDDDLYHPQRLSSQLAHMRRHRGHACFLVDQLQLFYDTYQLYWCDWHPNKVIHPSWIGPHLIPGTLMSLKSRLPEYPEINKGEDVHVKDTLCLNSVVAGLRNMPFLYVYTYHGANTWNRDHHRRILHWAAVCGQDFRQYSTEIVEHLNEYSQVVLPHTLEFTSRDNEYTLKWVRPHHKLSGEKARKCRPLQRR